MRVPQADPRLKPQIAAPSQPGRGNVPFSDGGIGQAGQQVAAAVGQAGEVIAQIGERQARLDKQEELSKIETAARAELQDALINDKNGLLNRKGDAAKGITLDFDDGATALKKKYMEQIKDPEVADRFAQSWREHALSTRGTVISHEATERRSGREATHQAYFSMLASDAALISDPAGIKNNVQAALDKIDEIAPDMGWSKPVAEQKKAEVSNAIIKSALMPMIEEDPRKAQRMLDVARGSAPEAALIEPDRILKGKMVEVQTEDVWKQVAALPRKNGYVDLSAAEGVISKLNESPERIKTIRSGIQARVALDKKIVDDNREANERGFINGLYEAVGKNDLDNAMKLAVMTAGDDIVQAKKNTDRVVEAFSQPRSLNDMIHEHRLKNPEYQRVWEEIKLIAEANYVKSNKHTTGDVPGYDGKVDLYDAYLNYMKRAAVRVKSPEELKDLAEKAVTKVKTPAGRMLESFKLETGRNVVQDRLNLMTQRYPDKFKYTGDAQTDRGVEAHRRAFESDMNSILEIE